MNPFAKALAVKNPSQINHAETTNLVLDIRRVESEVNEEMAALGLLEKAPIPDVKSEIPEEAKLSQLIDDNFPFDESQLAAVFGMVKYPAACLTGAAGTGKTTVTKKLVDTLLNSAPTQAVDLETYWKSNVDNPEDSEDEYEIKQRWVPSVCLVSYTGRSTQQIKSNFPDDWHGNIMTIHRALGYVPEWYEDFGPEGLKKKMRFVPTYTAEFRMPWDIIIIDEAGMLGLDLWHNLFAAMKTGCRVYFIGDINQLPPVHGRPIFGFALAKLPSWELTTIHRQQGANNGIVNAAWKVINGQVPTAESNFTMIELKGNAPTAANHVESIVKKLHEMNVYVPNRDTVITPTNGEPGQRGEALGQIPLNRRFSMRFNPETENPRYLIDGGRVKQMFAVGDKVMATKNDHEIGITNGMTGIITAITENPEYSGDTFRFGRLADVNAFFAAESHDDGDFSLDGMEDELNDLMEREKANKEKAERGPASHIVTVDFSRGDVRKEVGFGTLAEVASLAAAYAVTCHKMQGGECPVVIIVLHDSHKAMLYSEWLYTAITRASRRCILLYRPDALRVAVNKRKIKGANLKAKIQLFINLMSEGLIGKAYDIKLPEVEYDESDVAGVGNLPAVRSADLGTRLGLVPAQDVETHTAPSQPNSPAESPAARRTPDRPAFTIKKTIHVHVHVNADTAGSSDSEEIIDAEYVEVVKPNFSMLGAVRTQLMLEDMQSTKLLTYQPKVEEPAKPKNPWAAKLGLKMIEGN